MLLAAAFLALAQAASAAPPPAGALVHQSRLFELPDEAVGYIPASAPAHPPIGFTFAFMRNRLLGSHARLSACSRV